MSCPIAHILPAIQFVRKFPGLAIGEIITYPRQTQIAAMGSVTYPQSNCDSRLGLRTMSEARRLGQNDYSPTLIEKSTA